MAKKEKSDPLGLEQWVRNNQQSRCLICRTEGAPELIESVLAASEKLGLRVPHSRIVVLLRERNVLDTTGHTMRDHIRRCRGKAR